MEAYFRATFPDLSVRTMYRAVAFSDAVPGAVAAAFDPEKIDAGVRLLRLSRKGEVLVTREALESLTVKAVREGRPVSVKFADATLAELEAEASRRRTRALPEVPGEMKQAVGRIERRLGSGVTRIAEVRFQRQGSRHVAVITVAEDRLDEFEKLFL